ncbi:MAG: DUF1697 domain-containing protein, partial [Candidatus Dormibacteraceae bacterium]
RLAMAVGVVVLTREELAAALDADPYASEPNPRYVHLIFFASALDEAARERVAAAQEAVAARGSRDTATVLGRTLYLHTPDGFGTSDLAARLTKAGKQAPLGTARNRATVTKLVELGG